MEHLKHVFSHDKPYNIYCIGDMHFGVKQSQTELIADAFEDMMNDPNGLFLGMGDYCEFREPSHPFFDWKNAEADIQKQVEVVTELFDDVAEKTIGLLIGNHEEKLCKRITFDPFEKWCKDSDVPYLGRMANVEFCFPNGAKLNIIATHGYGGGRKTGGKVNLVEDYIGSVKCDALVMGHNHQLQSFVRTESHEGTDGKRKRVYKQVGFCGSFYDGYTDGAVSYAERAMYPPLPLGYLVMTVSPKGIGMRCVYQ
jgi:hypothetical protein